MHRHKVYFTADAHLGSRHHTDSLDVERALVAWLDSVKNTAVAIYFLGDMFDYWFEYKYVVPRGYVRFLGKCAELSDAGVDLHFFAGNHDLWMTDYLSAELGATIHHRPVVVDLMGKRFRLSHGDEEYKDQSWMLRMLYCIFRSRLCRCLYAAIHPRWTVGMAYRLSLASRRRGVRAEIQGRVPHTCINEYLALEDELLVRKAKAYSQEDRDIDVFVFGHRHLLVDMVFGQDKRMLILGDWIKYRSWAEWDGTNLALGTFYE